MTLEAGAYPILITNHDGWQIDGVRETFQKTDYDEIFFLNETMVVKDNSIWNIVFQKHKYMSVSLAEKFQMFCAKYLREYVEQTVFPIVDNRYDDITLGEDVWNHQYMSLAPYVLIEPITDVNPDFEENFEWKFGRKNMIVQNSYIKKWKSAWNISMVPRS